MKKKEENRRKEGGMGDGVPNKQHMTICRDTFKKEGKVRLQ